MRIVRPSNDASVQHLLDDLSGTEPTYEAIGATLRHTLPDGYRHDRYDVTLGVGDEVYARSVLALRTWSVHTGSGLRIVPARAPITSGTTIVALLGAGPVALVVPCRIVRVLDEADRFGFAYATLPGHPEEGEESFVVERSPSGAVTFRIVAFSRPAHWLVRLLGPFARGAQVRATKRYLRAMQRFVTR